MYFGSFFFLQNTGSQLCFRFFGNPRVPKQKETGMFLTGREVFFLDACSLWACRLYRRHSAQREGLMMIGMERKNDCVSKEMRLTWATLIGTERGFSYCVGKNLAVLQKHSSSNNNNNKHKNTLRLKTPAEKKIAVFFFVRVRPQNLILRLKKKKSCAWCARTRVCVYVCTAVCV